MRRFVFSFAFVIAIAAGPLPAEEPTSPLDSFPLSGLGSQMLNDTFRMEALDAGLDAEHRILIEENQSALAAELYDMDRRSRNAVAPLELEASRMRYGVALARIDEQKARKSEALAAEKAWATHMEASGPQGMNLKRLAAAYVALWKARVATARAQAKRAEKEVDYWKRSDAADSALIQAGASSRAGWWTTRTALNKAQVEVDLYTRRIKLMQDFQKRAEAVEARIEKASREALPVPRPAGP